MMDQISKMPVIMTVIGGKIVYMAPKFSQEVGSEHQKLVHPAALHFQ